MKETRLIMGMPITVEIVDAHVGQDILDKIFQYFTYIDSVFSTYKDTSEISKINKGIIKEKDYSQSVRLIFSLADETRLATGGYFDIHHNGTIDPSGIVKGWAINNAALLLKKWGFRNFYVDAGGDIQASGLNSRKKPWTVGIRNPFSRHEHVKTVSIYDQGIATSGTAIRGQHIYNPLQPEKEIQGVVSLSVVGPNVYEADRFATAAFAMGEKGIEFIAGQPGLEGYMISSEGIATYTEGFKKYII